MRKTGTSSKATVGGSAALKGAAASKRFARKGRIAPPSSRSYAVTMQTELQNESQNDTRTKTIGNK